MGQGASLDDEFAAPIGSGQGARKGSRTRADDTADLEGRGPRWGRRLGSEPLQFTLRGDLAPEEVANLCRDLRALLERRSAPLVVCDVAGLASADLVAVDALARLQLIARRCDSRLCLLHAPPDLCELLALLGMCDILPVIGIPRT